MLEVYGTPVCSDRELRRGHTTKHGFTELRVVREIKGKELELRIRQLSYYDLGWSDWRNKMPLTDASVKRVLAHFKKTRRGGEHGEANGPNRRRSTKSA